jgi:trk system potassium uptake protein TrkH
MLFAISIAGVMAALSLAGSLDFEDTMILTIASLSTTGPLLQIAGDIPVQLAPLNDAAKGIVSVAMILGRLETLAIIALLNPEFWR